MSPHDPSGNQLLGKLAEITLALSRILERIETRIDQQDAPKLIAKKAETMKTAQMIGQPIEIPPV